MRGRGKSRRVKRNYAERGRNGHSQRGHSQREASEALMRGSVASRKSKTRGEEKRKSDTRVVKPRVKKQKRVRGVKWKAEQKGGQRQPVAKFRRGKPRDVGRGIAKARERGVYGCGRERAKRRARLEGVSERARRGQVGEEVIVERESRLRQDSKGNGGLKGRVMGAERQRKENEGRQRERKRGTVRGKRRARGLPVRGQRTSTNGKTARKRNRKRR